MRGCGVLLMLVLIGIVDLQQQQFGQPPQQQFNQPPQQQQQQLNQPSPQQQQFNQQQQQQQFNQPPLAQQQQASQPIQQQQVKQQPPLNQAPPQQLAQQNVGQQPQQVRMPAPPPGQQQFAQQQGIPPPQFAQGVPPPQQQQAQRFAPGVPPPQQQQGQRFAPGVPPPQQQQGQRVVPGAQQPVQPPPGMTPQQFAALQAQQAAGQVNLVQGGSQGVQLPPGVSPQQFAAMQAQQAGAGQKFQLPPGVSPQQFAAMQAQQAGAQGVPQPQYPPGHAINIAPPTPPPPPAGQVGDWMDDAPGVGMEYKVHVEAGKEDCYWQYVHPGATVYVSYQVLKGGDGAIGMAVRNPQMKVVHPYEWKATSEYEEEDVPNGGYYSVCLDNQFSRFSAKLVNLYITTFRYDEWEKYSDELKDMDVAVENFTSALRTVDHRIQVMKQFQSMSRGGEARDFNVLQDNSSYVQSWSIAQILVVIICTVVQVNFVKSFFKDPKEGGGGFKMRT